MCEFRAIGSFAKQLKRVNDGNLSTADVYSVTKYDGFVRSLDYFKKQVFSRDLGSYKIVRKGEFAYSTIHLDEGALGLLEDKEALISPMYTTFQVDESVDRQYIAYLLRSPGLVARYSLIGQGSINRRKSVAFSSLAELEVFIPPLPEQKKIAEILSGVDRELHTCHENLAKTNLLRTSLLKSMMQGAEEDSIEQALGGIVEVTNGRAYKLAEWEREGTPVIRLQNLTKQGGHFYYSNLQLPEKQYCEKGDLLFMWSASFGPHIWWGEKAIYHYHIWKMIPKCNSLLKDYLYLFLQYKTEVWKSQGAGMAMIHLTKEGIEKETIPLPPVATQERIVNAIKSIDNRIEATKTKAKKILLMKGALSSDLLSGRKRVTL